MTLGCAGPGTFCVSINVNGLATPRKLGALVSYLSNIGAKVAFVQETKTTRTAEGLSAMLPGLSTLWPGAQLFCSPGTGHSRGVLTILDRSITHAAQSDLDGGGRVLRVDARVQGVGVALVNVYAPSNPAERRAFFTSLPHFLPTDGTPTLVGGDFNCVAAPALDCAYLGGSPPASNTRIVGASELAGVMRDLHLTDVWRDQHATKVDVTHFCSLHNSAARLDRWLVSASALQQFHCSSSIEAAAGVTADHLPVSIRLRLRNPPLEGRGMRSFPLALLNAAEDLEGYESFLRATCAQLAATPDDQLIEQYCRMKELWRTVAGRAHKAARSARLQQVRVAEIQAASARLHVILSAATAQPPAQPQQQPTPAPVAAPSSSAHGADSPPAPPSHNSQQESEGQWWDDVPVLSQRAAQNQPGVAQQPRAADWWRELASKAASAWQNITAKEVKTASMLDHQYGDGPSYLFHAQARLTHAPTYIQQLDSPAGAGVADLNSRGGIAAAQQIAVSYFSADSEQGLFKARPTDATAQSTLLRCVERTLPPHLASAAEGPGGDGQLTAAELSRALQSAARGSTPGIDGLPYEFYRAFQDTLIPLLVRVFNVAFSQTTTSNNLAPLIQGVICLIAKPGKAGAALRSLANYRPITLLNCDVKLLMLVLSSRLQRPLDYLIDISQSAFLAGRDIGDNVRYHLGLASRLQELGLPGWLLLSDLRKAYDSVDRSYLQAVMARMGFQAEGMLRWTHLLFGGTTARVRINGFLTDAFPIARSLAQGASVSCQHWAIVLQPLVSYLSSLQSSGRLTAISLPTGSPAPASQEFADDVKVLLVDPDADGPAVREAFSLNERASGVGQSADKSFLIHLTGDVPASLQHSSSQRVHAATGYNLVPDNEQTRLLGVPFAADQAACAEASFAAMPHSMRAASQRWARLPISQLGRVHVATSCLASKAVYQAAFYQPSPAQLSDMQRVINQYAADSTLPTEQIPYRGHLYPRQEIATLPVGMGGLGLPLMAQRCAANLTKMVWRSLSLPSLPASQLILGDLARAVPPGHTMPRGAQWVIYADQATAAAWAADIRTPSLRAAATAFSQIRFQRVLQPSQQDGESIMMEPTYHSGMATIDQAALRSVDALQWQRLRDVRAAYQRRQQLTADQRADLQLIIAAQPPPWRAAITAGSYRPCAWTVLPSPAGTPLVLEGPDPSTGRVCRWEAAQTGLLERMTAPFVRGPGQAMPALVVLQPRHPRCWDAEDRAFASAQAALPADQRQPVCQPRLISLWQHMDLDPLVWGLGPGHSLLDISVKDVRQQLEQQQHLRAASPPVEGMAELGLAWPAIWRREAPTGGSQAGAGHATAAAGNPVGQGDAEGRHNGAGPQAGQGAHEPVEPAAAAGSPPLVTPPAPQVGLGPPRAEPLPPDPSDDRFLDGLLYLEQRWRQQPQPGIYAREGNADDPPAWLREAAAPRPHPHERAQQRAQRGEVQPTGGLRRECGGVWARLQDTALHRPHRVVCWRVLHGQLGCNAFLHHVSPALHASACCTAPPCRQLHTPETLTHAFLECPEVQPAVAWLGQTWKQLAGARFAVPPSHTFLLADDPQGWAGAADPKLYRQWTRLRVAFLGAVWEARCSRGGGPVGVSFARRVAQATTATLVSAIWRDWLRTLTDVRGLEARWFCADWWRDAGFHLTGKKFAASWLEPAIFCRLGDGVRADLELRLGQGRPVPLPL